MNADVRSITSRNILRGNHCGLSLHFDCISEQPRRRHWFMASSNGVWSGPRAMLNRMHAICVDVIAIDRWGKGINLKMLLSERDRKKNCRIAMNFTLKRNKSFFDFCNLFFFFHCLIHELFLTRRQKVKMSHLFLWPFLYDCFDVVNNNWYEMIEGFVGKWGDLKLSRGFFYGYLIRFYHRNRDLTFYQGIYLIRFLQLCQVNILVEPEKSNRVKSTNKMNQKPAYQ